MFTSGFSKYLIFILVILWNWHSINGYATDSVADGNKLFNEKTANFSARFFCELVHGDKKRSLITSPVSLILGLAPLAVFSEGKTYHQIRNVLNMDKVEMLLIIPNVIKMLNGGQGKAILELAGMTFYHEPFILTNKFKKAVTILETETRKFNFTNSTLAVETANNWISNKTHGMVTMLAEPSMFQYPATMVLASTIYFKDSWSTHFSYEDEGIFYSSRGKKRIVYLIDIGEYEYMECPSEDYQILVKRYSDPKFSCIFILPDSVTGLLELAKQITQENKLISIIRRKYTKSTVNVTVPMFAIKSVLDAGLILSAMGIKNLYTDSLFKDVLIKPNGLSDDDRVVFNKTIQGVQISMNQYGTESATPKFSTTNLSNRIPRQNFTADHPYLFLIVREETILFLGCYDG